MAPKKDSVKPQGAATMEAVGDDDREEEETEVKADPAILAMQLQIQTLQNTIIQLMSHKQPSESKWLKPSTWDSDKEPENWHKFKKIVKSSLSDVGLEYLTEEEAREEEVGAAQWRKDNTSLYNKLITVTKGIAQDIVMTADGQRDCGRRGWLALCGKFENTDTRERRIKALRRLIVPSWDAMTDPDKVFISLHENQKIINGMQMIEGEHYSIPDVLVSDIIVASAPEELYAALVPVILHDKTMKLEPLKDLVRDHYSRAKTSPLTKALFTQHQQTPAPTNARGGGGTGGQSPRGGKFPWNCHYCENKGHKKVECNQLKAALKKPCGNCGETGKCVAKWCKKPKKQQEETPKKVAACVIKQSTALRASSSRGKDRWFGDSGAEDHMTTSDEGMINKRPCHIRVVVGGEHELQAVCIGDVTFHKRDVKGKLLAITLYDTLYVPGLKFHLVSLGKIRKNGGRVVLGEGEDFLQFASGDRINVALEGNLITMDWERQPASPSGEVLSARALAAATTTTTAKTTSTALITKAEESMLWHRRFGHRNYQDVVATSKIPETCVPGDLEACDCETCAVSKARRISFPRMALDDPSLQPMEVLVADLYGPVTVSPGVKAYLFGVQCRKTRYKWGRYLDRKWETAKQMRSCLDQMHREVPDYKVRRIHTDNAKEFFTPEAVAVCTARGIYQTKTGAYSPEQNGQAERVFRTLGEGATCLLDDSGLDKGCWTYAVETLIHVSNRTSSRVLGGASPYYALYGKHPNLSHLRVFGCTAYVLKPQHQQKKLERKAWVGAMVGYDPHNSRAYIILDPVDGVLRTSVHVKFNESLMFMDRVTRPRELDLQLATADVGYDTLSGSITASVGGTAAAAVDGDSVGAPAPDSVGECLESVQHKAEATAAALEDELQRDGHESDDDEKEPEVSIYGRRRKSTLCQDQKCPIKGAHSALEHALDAGFDGYSSSMRLAATPRKLGVMEKLGLAAATKLEVIPEVDPKTEKEVDQSPNATLWRQAKVDEYTRLEAAGSWEKVEASSVPPGTRVLGSGMVYKTKLDNEGLPARLKARGVVKGWKQEIGIDFDESYAPVAQHKTVRMVASLAAHKDKEIHQIDIVQAFINAGLKETVHVKDFPGFETIGSDGKPMVLKLKRSLYGLKQAPRNWNDEVHQWLEGYGLMRSQSDPCLYVKRDKPGEVDLIVVLYVDDMMIVGDLQDVEKFKKAIGERYQIQDLGELKWMLGMEFKRDRKNRAIEINQSMYVKQVLEKTDMADSKGAYVPMAAGTELVANTEEPPVKHDHKYSRDIGSGMYAVSLTRPDGAYWIGRVSKYMNNPSQAHHKAVKNGLRYLKQTQGLGLKFGGRDIHELKLEAFADADYASDKEKRRSLSGYVIMFGGAAVSWKSKQQPCTAQSTAEAEYVALCEAAKEVVYLRRMCRDLGVEQVGPTPMYEDNQACISMVNFPVYTDRNKHIDVRYHYTRSLVEEGIVEVSYVSTHDQLADIFTKALSQIQFEKLRDRIMGYARY